ncbi:hypothetical protein KW830_06440 [Comamonas sp. CMM03]|uniref:hypothetical protein n=1 Tax=Comamonas TaxID=283 RepID=UPI001C45331F|nr:MULTISPECIES: hypothetical protein [Comamonas]MBV7418091.1 hypothetical protein [Comamonas sp. CMM03]
MISVVWKNSSHTEKMKGCERCSYWEKWVKLMRKFFTTIFLAWVCGASAQADGEPAINEALLRNALGERLSGTESAELRALEIIESKKEKGDFQICGEIKVGDSGTYTPFLVYIVNMEKYSVLDISPNARKLCTLVKNGDV